MFALRQVVEKLLEMQGRVAVGFLDLEKAYDTVPREMVKAAVRWMGVPEAEEFPVNIGLRQGSALCSVLLIMVMELIIRKINTKDVLRKIWP